MRRAEPRPKALFVGLCTLDIIQLVDHVPAPDEKLTALAQTIAAGGPAANAAATYAHLGGAATLVTGIGAHPLAAGVTADLADLGIGIVDLDSGTSEPPTVSSILVTAGTGERAVASVNATGRRLSAPPDLGALLSESDVVEFDGHHMPLAVAAARTARSTERLTVLDGGSWKAGTEELLPWIDVAVCSADFRPPKAASSQNTLEFLQTCGVRWAAVSRGAEPILWAGPGGSGEVEVPKTEVADTLGAGDVLHGALTYHLSKLSRGGRPDARVFVEALTLAGRIAARACASFGTRTWMLTHSDGARQA